MSLEQVADGQPGQKRHKHVEAAKAKLDENGNHIITLCPGDKVWICKAAGSTDYHPRIEWPTETTRSTSTRHRSEMHGVGPKQRRKQPAADATDHHPTTSTSHGSETHGVGPKQRVYASAHAYVYACVPACLLANNIFLITYRSCLF